MMVFPPDVTQPVWDASLAALRGWLARAEPFYVVCDSSKMAKLPNAKQRQSAGEFNKQESSRRYIRGWANVAPSAMTRGLITAISWLAPDPWPMKAVATQAEAKAWLRTLIDKHR
jgi:hypothetical protein